MRGDNSNVGQQTPVELQVKKVGNILTANVIDPNTGQVHFHIIAPAALKIIGVLFGMGMLATVLMLGLIIYNKTEIDQLKKEVQVQEETNANTSNRNR